MNDVHLLAPLVCPDCAGRQRRPVRWCRRGHHHLCPGRGRCRAGRHHPHSGSPHRGQGREWPGWGSMGRPRNAPDAASVGVSVGTATAVGGWQRTYGPVRRCHVVHAVRAYCGGGGCCACVASVSVAALGRALCGLDGGPELRERACHCGECAIQQACQLRHRRRRLCIPSQPHCCHDAGCVSAGQCRTEEVGML